MARGSLPWLILAAVLATLFAIWFEASFIAPFADGIMGSSLWSKQHTSQTAEGKRMVGDAVRNGLVVVILGIWVGLMIDARRRAG